MYKLIYHSLYYYAASCEELLAEASILKRD